MVPDKMGNSLSARSGVHLNLPFAEPPYRPTCKTSIFIEGGVSVPIYPCLTVPKVAVSLNDQPSRLEHEVWLPTSKHSFVHLELETAFLELVVKKALNRCHFLGERLPQSGLAYSLFRFYRKFVAQGVSFAPHTSAHFLTLFRGSFPTQIRLTKLLSITRHEPAENRGLAHPLACFRRSLTPKHRLPSFLCRFRGLRSSFRPTHFMFNYNTSFSEEEV